MKVCTVCKKELDYSYYHKSSLTRDGYGYRCAKCDKEARENYREKNKDRFYMVSRRKNLKFKYGITLEEYQELLNSQDGKCACCGVPENKVTGKRSVTNFAVDHCHSTGRIRGLLCNQCNGGIGMLGDTEESLKKALDYLRKTK